MTHNRTLVGSRRRGGRASTACLTAGLIVLFFGLLGGTPASSAGGSVPQSSSPQGVPLAILAQTPGQFVNQTVDVTGTLYQVGANYFIDPFFVLVDPEGSWLQVDPWAPLELPPSPPGSTNQRTPTMEDYLGRSVRVVVGELADAGGGRYLLRVQQVEVQPVVPETGEVVGNLLQQMHADRVSALRQRLNPGADPSAKLEAPAQLIPPKIGTRKPLVLLVDFSDKVAQTARSYFQDLLFGNHPTVAPKGSFRDYYLEASYGQLTTDGAVNPPSVGWLRLPQTLAYYVSGGSNGTGTYPGNAQKMVEDAIAAAHTAGINFGAYDTDSDGYVDDLMVVHAGRGAELTGSSSDIWSHRWSTRADVDTGSTNALGHEVYVRGYSTEPEYWYVPSDMTMGVYTHEFGHQLGLPDLYDTDNTSEGIGNWSVMAAGSWNGNVGDTPAHFDPWSKACLTWLTPTKVTAVLQNQSIPHASGHQAAYQFLDGQPGVSGEYFLVENRYKRDFDAGLPGSGLLVWHVDEAQLTNNNEWYPGCTTCTGHYKLAMLQADNLWQLEHGTNRGDTGDPFPGTLNRTSIDGLTSPSSALNASKQKYSWVSISNISAAGETMTATLTPPSFVTDRTAATVPEGATSTFQVKLAALPTSTVTVSVSRTSTGDQDITVQSGASLTFTTGNWNVYQTVTLAAAEDADSDNGVAKILIKATGLTDQYISATETDNDPQYLPDPCSGAAVMSQLPYLYAVSTTTATTETGDPTPLAGSGSRANSVWFKLVAPSTGSLTVDTMGSSYDTILSAWTGTCGSFSHVASNDDANGTLQSQVTVSATSGTTYWFMVTSYSSGGGLLKFRAAYALPNDNCASAAVATQLPYSDRAGTMAATTETSDPTPKTGSESRARSVWYKLTAPTTGNLLVTTSGSSYDTILSAFTGTCGTFTQVASNDDGAYYDLTSQLLLPVTAGTTYWFMVTAYSGDGGVLAFATSYQTQRDRSIVDFDGDGRTDPVVWRPSTGSWYALKSSDSYSPGTYLALQWGSQTYGDVPVPGDYDGDGKTDIAVWRPSTGMWYVLKSSNSYSDVTYLAVQWGSQAAGDVPVQGDYDGDGKTDIAVWRPSTGMWYVLKSSDGYTTYLALQWGASSDTPVHR